MSGKDTFYFVQWFGWLCFHSVGVLGEHAVSYYLIIHVDQMSIPQEKNKLFVYICNVCDKHEAVIFLVV